MFSTVSTSPWNLNVDADVSLSALPALPVTLPLTVPSNVPINVVAYILRHLKSLLPMLLVLLRSGSIKSLAAVSTTRSLLPSVIPFCTLIESPTFNVLATPTPPLTTTAPLLIVVLCVTAFVVIIPLVLKLPVTSNASSGASLLIPTLKLESILKTVLLSPAFLTLKSIFEPSMLCCTTPALPSIPMLSSPLMPYAIPLLF